MPFVRSRKTVSVVSASSMTSSPTTSFGSSIGNVIVVWVFKDGTAIPVPPAAGGNVPTWNTLTSGTNSVDIAWRVCWAVASTATVQLGAWTNISDGHYATFSGASTTSPFGGAASGTGTAATMTYPAITLADSSGKSQLLYASKDQAGQSLYGGAPTGYTRIANAIGLTLMSKNSTTSDGSTTVDMLGSANYFTHSLEIVGA